MQSHSLHFDRLAKAERQPVHFAHGSILTWDGRLDNRDDLLLRLQREVGHDHSDAAIVAAAYGRWGVDCLGDVVGDWSLAVWDASAQRLILARDYAGNRQLYYFQRQNTFAWATSLDGLIDAFALTEPDDAWIAAALMGVSRADIAPFAGVRMLRSGHVAVASAAGVDVKRYWKFNPKPIIYRRQRDYIDHLRQLLIEAVRVRLRASRTVWSHLSGGLDSSSIVCLAHRLLVTGAVEAPRLQPLTWTFPNYHEHGERERVAEVEAWCGLSTVHSPFQQFRSAAAMFAAVGRRRPIGWRETIHEPEVLQAGDHVVLTGVAGDTIMLNRSSARLALCELLLHGHPLEFVRQCHVVSTSYKRPILSVFQRLLWEWCYGEMQPGSIARLQKAERRLPIGITPYLQRRVPKRHSHMHLTTEFSRIKRPLVLVMYKYTEGVTLDTDTHPLLWRTHPYMHRPLVEYVIAVPPLALWGPETNRAGMKKALVDILPPGILTRTDKTFYEYESARIEHDRAEQFDLHKHSLGPTDKWQLVARGYVEKKVLREAFAIPDTTRPHTSSFMTACVDLELWLRALTARESDSPGVTTPNHPVPIGI